MARPTKQGIDYFPLDCQFDDKTEMFIIEKGAVGLSVLVTIWQMIYSGEGYYIRDDNDLHLLIKRKIDAGINDIIDCINSCLRRGIFDEFQHKQNNILTSKAIQNRYFLASKKKKIVHVIAKYLIDGVSVSDNWVYVGGNATKGKEKEKGKEKGDIYTHSPTQANGVPYQKIINLYHEKLPENPHIASLSVNRKAQIKARWRNGLPDLEAWETYFSHVHKSDFLTGKAQANNGRKPFVANIDFLIKENNVLKIIEGNYHG